MPRGSFTTVPLSKVCKGQKSMPTWTRRYRQGQIPPETVASCQSDSQACTQLHTHKPALLQHPAHILLGSQRTMHTTPSTSLQQTPRLPARTLPLKQPAPLDLHRTALYACITQSNRYCYYHVHVRSHPVCASQCQNQASQGPHRNGATARQVPTCPLNTSPLAPAPFPRWHALVAPARSLSAARQRSAVRGLRRVPRSAPERSEHITL